MMTTRHSTHRRLLVTLMCAAGLFALPATAQAPNDVRVALIIGNSAYPGNMALANPSNDAKDMASTLRGMGFGVVEVLDGNRVQMTQAIERINQELKGKQGVGMLFYAGHGLQLDWHNYMVPVDAKLASAADVPKQTIDIETVLSAFKSSGNRMNIVVLDACRDNPFADSKAASGKGLAPLDAPTGTFLAYATAPGNVAQDGIGKNGLYTSYLLQELQKPSTSIENVFKRVRLNVRKASEGAQIPWETTSLEDDFFFNSGIRKFAREAETHNDRQFELEKADWDKIKNSKLADDFYAYLVKYPNGLISEQASFALEQLSKTKIISQIDKNGVPQNSDEKRYRVGDEYVLSYKNLKAVSKSEMAEKRSVARVEKIKDGLVYIQTSGGLNIATEDGAIVQAHLPNGVYDYDPPTVFQPGDGFQIGKKWTARTIQTFANQSTKRTDMGEVVSVEDIIVPAGTFKTYKVIITTQLENGNKAKNTFWYQPGWGSPVKRHREVWNAGGVQIFNEIYELVSRVRGS